MTRSVIAGVALATAVLAGQSAEAGHRHRHRDCHCQPACATANQGGWYYTRSPGGYYVPMARSENIVPASSVTTGGPPMAPSSGQTIQRFSEEPNTPPAIGGTYAPTTSYSPQFDAPSAGNYVPTNSSRTPSRNPVERRLRPGGGWMRN